MDATFAIAAIGSLLLLIFLGVDIAIALGVAGFAGLIIATGRMDASFGLLTSTAFEALRDYLFIVIPMFILMGELIARCGAASDLFIVANRLLRRIPGRMMVATVGANVIFAAVVGVSIASASAFARIAYPPMRAAGYDRRGSLGVIAGSACLGMIIPPSILFIIWGVLTEISIGKLFMAGVFPGLLLASLFIVYIMIKATLTPGFAGELRATASGATAAIEQTVQWGPTVISTIGVLLLIVGTIVSIWGGFATPTEASAFGAFGALLVALVKGMRWTGIRESILEAGRVSGPILIILITAQMYSRMLASAGVVSVFQNGVQAAGLGPWTLLLIMVVIWVILGMFLDSVSIILLTVPLFGPVAIAAGWDPIAYAVIGVLAIETGLLTPPFGLVVFSVKATVPDRDVSLSDVFRGALPYVALILICVFSIAAFPALATWLPGKM